MTSFKLNFLFSFFALAVLGCGDDDVADAAMDAGVDAIVDASPADVGDRATPDVAIDMVIADQDIPDASPPRNPIESLDEVMLIEGEFAFLEGPQYRTSDGALYFSDIPADTIHRLLPNGEIEAFRMNQPTNGLLFDSMDRLHVATQTGRTLVRFEGDGTETVIASEFNGEKLNSPNDLVLRADGNLYFTDPPYGINVADSERDCSGIYRVDPAGNLTELWCENLDTRPNGIGLSPDGSTLYVAFTHNGEILSWDVAADGSVSNQQDFASTTGGADGLAIDVAGNLFVTSNSGVEVFAPTGTKWGTIPVAEQPANCAFGGTDNRTLYITARRGLYSVIVHLPGL